MPKADPVFGQYIHKNKYIFLILLLLKGVGNKKQGESAIHPIRLKTQLHNTNEDRKMRKEKREETKKEQAAYVNKKALALRLS